ncbi:MAG: putative membrane protein YczE [Paracrocinitomix sp.]
MQDKSLVLWYRALQFIGASRHTALARVRERHVPIVRHVGKRSALLMLGSLLIGAAVSFLVQAGLGLAPYDVLADSLSGRLGLSLGQSGWAVAAVLFAVAAMLGQRPTMWGIAYILANGFAVDITSELLRAPTTTVGQVIYLVAAILLMASGVNLVLYSGTTGGPFELLMSAGSDRGIKEMYVRYALDVGTLTLGISLGGSFGVATVIYAALMGVVLETIHQAFMDYDRGRKSRLSNGEQRSLPPCPSKDVRRVSTTCGQQRSYARTRQNDTFVPCDPRATRAS